MILNEPFTTASLEQTVIDKLAQTFINSGGLPYAADIQAAGCGEIEYLLERGWITRERNGFFRPSGDVQSAYLKLITGY